MTALLSQALVAFAIEYENHHAGPLQWAGNLLQKARDDGGGIPPLPEIGTHSLQNLNRLGIVTRDQDEARLTAVGRAMRDAYQPLCEQVESRWRRTFGASLVDEVVDAVGVVGPSRPFPLVAWTGSEFALVD